MHTQKLLRQHTELSERLRSVEGSLQHIEAGLSIALMALKIDKDNAARDPDAAAAAANLLANGLLYKVR